MAEATISFDGFYKCEYRAGPVLNRSVMHVRGGRMLGGNSAFAHIGSYQEVNDGEVVGQVAGQRHATDPSVSQLYGADDDVLNFRGRAIGHAYHFACSPVRIPDAVVNSIMTRLDEASLPPPGRVDAGGILNGLYALRMRALDGVDSGLTGVMLLQDGRMLGGDAFFYYLGSYSSAQGRWKGEIVNQEHTKANDAVFGGREVGIGFSGACDDRGATWEAIALAGKRSIRLSAEMELLHKI
ncbi:hypothetical protein RPMA_07325 [Tardiphaga alba]|uniref:Type III secretion system (T3SS) negative regulator GrlR n=2 Tax=Tardiphaga alba TaxID=340268 RepID=A0ABX8AFI0_9BRAD|nr:hypothetical protein RPMA_07325 [Tardiphaga alba]